MKGKDETLDLWGHLLVDYRRMYDLTNDDLKKSILECGAGFSSFNAEMTKQGCNVISCDNFYQNEADQLKALSNTAIDSIYKAIQRSPKSFVWDKSISIEDLQAGFHRAAAAFLGDFESGKKEGRYIPQNPPGLPFENQAFDLVLCSHLLFKDGESKSIEEAIVIVSELCRIGNEIRIFPLLDQDGNLSNIVGPVMIGLQAQDYGVEIREVPYQLQKGGNAMLRIWDKTCEIDKNPAS